MAYQKPVEVCMDLFGANNTCNTDPILRFIPIEQFGNLYFKLGEPATNLRNRYFTTTFGTLTSDISLSIGDTISFSYTANNLSPLTGENFIESADGVNFFGFDSALAGRTSFVGYTATFNGAAINSGDRISSGSTSQYPIGGARDEHTVVLTATTATDIRFIGTTNLSTPIYDVTIVTSGQTWIYPIDSTTVTNPDSNGSGNDLTLSSNTFIINYPVLRNTAENAESSLAPYFTIDSKDFGFATNNFNYQAPSLRVDGSGNSLDTNGSSRYFLPLVDPTFAYKDGFTLEVTSRFIGAVSSGGRACGVVSASSNTASNSLWRVGFDDYDGSASGSGTIRPTFDLLERNPPLPSDESDEIDDSLARVTGSEVVSGSIYHMMFTIRPSNFSVEFWVNGASVGSIILTRVVFEAWLFGNFGEFGVQDVKNGIFGTRLDIGPRLTNGAWRGGQDCHIQDIKIHLFEANTAFAQAQATFANFTV